MNKLAIVGTHPDTRGLAPFDDDTWDIWVFNEAPQDTWCKRWTACFQMHKPEVYTSLNNFVNKGHWAWLQEDHGMTKTIWMQERDERVPNSVRYPLDELRATIPAASLGMLTSTVTQALALGLYLGYERIETWGANLGSNTEYAYQQPGWLYWSGVAKGILGDGFQLHDGLQNFVQRVYGYEGETQIDPNYFSRRAEELSQDKFETDKLVRKLRDRIQESIIDARPDRFANIIGPAQDAIKHQGEVDGMLQEAQMYAERAQGGDPITRQQFERRCAQGQIDTEANTAAMHKEFGKMEYVANVWKATNNDEAIRQLRVFYNKMLEYAYTAGGNIGVTNENARYMAEYDSRVQAAGGQRTLTALGVKHGN